MGRLDWWNLRSEHTEAEWEAQKAMYQVAPFGERRADLRAAIMTANLMTMQAANKQDMTDDEFRQVVSGLMHYLPDADDFEDAADLAALKRLRAAEEQ